MLGALLVLQVLSAAPGTDPFAFFAPTVILNSDERSQLDRGEPIARVLPGQGLEVAVFAAVRVAIPGDRLVSWMRRIEELKKSSYVLAIGRFSDPPRLEDLGGLALDEEDVGEIRACRPGRCGLKLSALEMAELQQAAAEEPNAWRDAVQRAFRRLVLRRVQTYLADGSVRPYDDQNRQISPVAQFASLLEHTPFLIARIPRFADHLRGYPQTTIPEVDSFVYWSKERLARSAVIGVTHVNILRSRGAGLPDVLVAGKEIFATHYVNTALGLTALLQGDDGYGYLAYLNRTDVDAVGGLFGGLVRWFAERRIRTEAALVLRGLRQRLESGEPPPTR